MNPYRKRIFSFVTPILDNIAQPASILDFGCGDGWFATQVKARFPDSEIVAIDVTLRKNALIEPVIYAPGEDLPFGDASFDLVYAIDVLHHCAPPAKYLKELARVARRYILIKDHVQQGPLSYLALSLLDELGNRRFGIPSPQNYQKEWEWSEHLESLGWAKTALIHPCHCHTGLLGALTNRLQYVALYERVEECFRDEKLQSR